MQRENRYRYTEWTSLQSTDRETMRQLYDVENNPFEYENLVLNEKYGTTVTKLSQRLKAGWQAELP